MKTANVLSYMGVAEVFLSFVLGMVSLGIVLMLGARNLAALFDTEIATREFQSLLLFLAVNATAGLLIFATTIRRWESCFASNLARGATGVVFCACLLNAVGLWPPTIAWLSAVGLLLSAVILVHQILERQHHANSQ